MALDEGVIAISAMHNWLVQRGYKVSRSAVQNYAKHCRRNFLTSMRRQLDDQSDAELREKLATWSRGLSGSELVAVASLAAFHAEKAGRPRKTKGIRPEPSETELADD